MPEVLEPTTNMPNTANPFVTLEHRLGAHNYHPLEVVLARGEGVWVWDTTGKKYLDCLSAYSALNQGHCHPEIINALVTQAAKVTLTSRAFFNDQLGPLYESLTRILGFEAVLPMNTGAEAVETAIKLVRKWAYTSKKISLNQAEIIVMGGNFQGRTTTIVSFSSEGQYKDLFGPLTPGFVTVPYGEASALEAAINPNTAAIMLEPIQGEAGVVVPPDGYLQAVRDACDRHGLLMVADEIQTGLGRTGKWLACDHENVRPDVVILGKALGLSRAFEPTGHGCVSAGRSRQHLRRQSARGRRRAGQFARARERKIARTGARDGCVLPCRSRGDEQSSGP
jgi:ornithine--oxo-acid transaminase